MCGVRRTQRKSNECAALCSPPRSDPHRVSRCDLHCFRAQHGTCSRREGSPNSVRVHGHLLRRLHAGLPSWGGGFRDRSNGCCWDGLSCHTVHPLPLFTPLMHTSHSHSTPLIDTIHTHLTLAGARPKARDCKELSSLLASPDVCPAAHHGVLRTRAHLDQVVRCK